MDKSALSNLCNPWLIFDSQRRPVHSRLRSPDGQGTLALFRQRHASEDAGVSSYDAKTGTLIYQQRLPSSFSASPVAANGKLYLASEDGDVFVVKAGRQYELLQKNVMGQPLMATPALTQGMLIVRADNAIYALGERKTAKN